MKIVQINACSYGSTGKIMLQLAKLAEDNDYESYVCFPDSRSNRKIDVNFKTIIIGSILSRNVHMFISRFTGFNGLFSNLSTFLFIKKLKKIHPDIIHLHNIHNWFINIPMLFNYIKTNNVRVVWTLHDCWAFTGQCPYFTIAKCDKWKNGCFDCKQIHLYPSSKIDQTRLIWNLKKKWFSNVANMTIVTPSQWLGNLVKQSYLKDYNLKVINNGIDLSTFKPIESNFKKKYNIKEYQTILLGVSFCWDFRKGLDVFVDLAKKIDDNFVIVLVGTDNEIDKTLPNNVISIHRTNNQKELAMIYTAADFFINPTREENYPTVNMESIACGTPVITFNTGGSPEIIDSTCGLVLKRNDVDCLYEEIIRLSSNNPYSIEKCIEKAKQFDKESRLKEYLKLYEEKN